MSIAALIVAGGRGTRAADGTAPKQYQQIAARSMLGDVVHTFRQHSVIETIQVVIHRDDEGLYRNTADRDGFADGLRPPVFGGDTRQASVFAGLIALEALPQPPELVLIHDAARPFVSYDLLTSIILALETCPGVMPGVPMADTLQRVDDTQTIVGTVGRANLWRAQTPQGFRFHDILAAHRKARAAGETEFTDDATLLRWAGGIVHLVRGSEVNRKITTQEDLVMARQFHEHSETKIAGSVRFGTGFDVHKIGPGDHIWLCGVKVDAPFGLVGHSDADVALHALTDALLGALGDGDIGQHFPPSDPRWKDAASDQFLRDAARRLRAQRGEISNVDVTLICEQPKIGPLRDAMRARIADILEVAIGRVSVKATTSEGLGFTGRREGIAAMASASVVMAE